jgi:hypothetical protein
VAARGCGRRGQRARRPVCLPDLGLGQEVVTTAAGSIDLLARMDDQGPSSCWIRPLCPLADHTSSWPKITLSGARDSDGRQEGRGTRHFALGLLHGARAVDRPGECRLVASSPAQSGAHSLLRSGKLKVRLGLRQARGSQAVGGLSRDTAGRPGLLADATLKAGM